MSDPRKAALAAYVTALFVDPAAKARVARAWARSPEAAALEIFACVKEDVEVVGDALGRALASRAVDAGAAFVDRTIDAGRAAVGEALQGIARGLKEAIAPTSSKRPRRG